MSESTTLQFTDAQWAAYRTINAPAATDDQWAFFRLECERRALIPGVHVIFQLRTTEEFNQQLQRKVSVQKVTLITTIGALRLIAQRSGKFEGYGRFCFFYTDDSGEPTIKSEIPRGRIPHAVSVELYRAGWRNPVFSFARYDAAVQLKSDKNPTAMWFKRGEEQLAKCAEANGLRMVAPEECGGLYIEEEINQQQERQPETGNTQSPVVLPQATTVLAVNQAPAEQAWQPGRPMAAGTGTIPQNGGLERTAAESTAAPVEAASVAVQVAEQPQKSATTNPTPVVTPASTKSAPPKPPARRPGPKPTPAPAAPAPAPANVLVKANELKGEFLEEKASHDGQESHAELEAVSERIARDPDPAANVHGVVATDDDLPAGLGEPTVKPARTEPVTQEEYAKFMERAAKIVRDKLEKDAKLKGSGPLVKDYLLKGSVQPVLKKISAADFERLISALEKATPEEAANLVKEGK